MNQCAVQQNAFAAYGEDMWTDRKSPVFCPKPRRIGHLAGPDPLKLLRWQASYQADLCDSKHVPQFLDIFLIKGGDIASSPPPFFCGSPPTRAANPVVHDARFGTIGLPGTSPIAPISPGKTCAPRDKFGFKQATVRVEGFDCLDRDRRHSQSVRAMA